jgi:SPOR domain
MMATMKLGLSMLCLGLMTAPALAGPAVEQAGPLSPCAAPQAATGGDSAQPAPAPSWGVELATSFSKDEALAQFAKVKQDHSNLLGAYEATVVETCDLHMGTSLQYSARIGLDSRDAADALCAKLRDDGGACIVQKN